VFLIVNLLMKLQPNEAVIVQFCAGDRKAYEVVYTYYYKYVFVIAYMILGDQHGAKDIASEVFLRLWEQRKRFSKAEGIKKWLIVTCRRASLNELRSRQRRQASEKELQFLSREEQLPYEHFLIGEEVVQELLQQLELLPSRGREVLELLFFQGQRTAEVAGRLGISGATVQSHKTKALMRLRAFRQRLMR